MDIGSERPITTSAVVKTWLSQGFPNLVSVWRHKETKTNKGSHIVYITKKVAHQHAKNATAIRRSQVVQDDLPFAFGWIYLRDHDLLEAANSRILTFCCQGDAAWSGGLPYHWGP